MKQQAHELIDRLPATATWDDLVYELGLRASIERGLADSEAERIVAIEHLMKEFGAED